MKLSTCSIILLSFLIIFKLSFAQEFIPAGAEWNYNYGPDIGGGIAVITLKYTGDEMVQSKMCKRLDVFTTRAYVWNPSDTTSGQSVNPYYLYENGDTVFFFNELDSNFYVLYNFDAQVGDSWKFPARECDSLVTIQVVSKDMVVINNDSLRSMEVVIRQNYSPLDPRTSIDTQRIIEKLGVLDRYFMLEHNLDCVTDLTIPGPLLCYKNDSFPTYQLNDSIPCNYRFVSVEPKEDLSFNIYPNPANNSLFIQSQESVQLEIYSCLGVLVENSSMKSGTRKIDISQYMEGVYYYSISDSDGSVLKSGSFVKQ